MELGLGALIVAFIVTTGMIKLLQPFAVWLELVDKPGGRKKHDGVIPLIGGIAVFSGLFISAYIFLEQPTFIRFFMLGCAFMVFLGALDDRYDISPRTRLIGQVLIACVFVYGLEITLSSFGNLFGYGEINVGWAGYLLAILSLVGVVNAFNMLDGIDGLVGSLGVIAFMGLTYLFATAGLENIALMCLLFMGALCAFLIFNIWGKPSRSKRINKIFMGDAGSMLLGLAVGVLLIFGAQPSVAAFDPIVAIWFVLLPMTDMFTLMYRRLRRGKSPVAPDRTHIHHILVRAGFKSWQALYILVLVQMVLILCGIVMSLYNVPEVYSFGFAVVFVGLYQLLMKRSWRFIRWNKKRFAVV